MTQQQNDSTEDRGARLTGRLGVGSIIFMVVAAAAPLSVIAGALPIGIAAGNGAAFPAAYLVCTGVLLLFAVGFTAMSKHVTDAGAFASYVATGLGRAMGRGAAFLALASYAAIQVAILAFTGTAITTLVVDHGGPATPWWAWSLGVLLVVGALGYRHIEMSGRVLGILLVAEVLVVVAMDARVIASGGGPQGFSTAIASPSAFFEGAPGIALMFAIAGYVGFEATAIFRDEARDPNRTIPRATYGALLLIGGFYAVSAWAVVSAWGDDAAVARATADPGTMIVETAVRTLGPVGGDVVQVLLVTSLFAAVLSFHNVMSRYLFSLGSDVLPSSLNRCHPRHRSPHVASVVTTAAGVILLLTCLAAHLDPVLQVFTWFAGISVIGLLSLMLMTSIAGLVFFTRNPDGTSWWRGRGAATLGAVGLGWLSWMSIDNLPLLVGGSTTVAIALGAALCLAFVTGVFLAVTRPRRLEPTPSPETLIHENH